jgi:hypothetical protein
MSILYTCLWVGGIYLLERPTLKKCNAVTRWCSISLLLASGVMWQVLTMSSKVPRPAEWLDVIFSPLNPVP